MKRVPVFLCLFAVFVGLTGFSQDDGVFQPLDISFDVNKLKALDFGSDSLDGDKILFQLFPAPMNEDDPELSEWRVSAFWKCSSCIKRGFVSYEDTEMTEIDSLPYDANYTVCTNILYYQSEKGSLRAVASFSTSLMNDGTGRFTRGLLSLAHFEKQNGRWKLLNFEPFVNFQGTFTLASPVDEVMIGENGKTCFLIHGGEANGVSPEEYWPVYQGLYVIDGKSLVELLHIPGASCQENNDPIGSVWDTEIKSVGSSPVGATVIHTKTSGLIVKEYNWGVPEVLKPISKTDFESLPDRFTFSAEQEFIADFSGTAIERQSIHIHYTDAKGVSHERVLK